MYRKQPNTIGQKFSTTNVHVLRWSHGKQQHHNVSYFGQFATLENMKSHQKNQNLKDKMLKIF